jgi:hypothetical protein
VISGRFGNARNAVASTAACQHPFTRCLSTSDHIIARQHGGLTVLENLALSCLHCNRHKGPDIAGRDAATGEIVRLFHPRQDRWTDHFEWAGAALVGRTTILRVTIQVLAMNAPDVLAVRGALIRERSAGF